MRHMMWMGSLWLFAASLVSGQGSRLDYEESAANFVVDPSRLDGLQYRSVGFSRGGRSTAVAGVPSQPLVYYFGGTGGGVWKTKDAGNNWKNVTDGFLGVGSIGAIAVAPSDSNVVYVGTGSTCPRGNISVGDGIYKSTDAGKTWQHIGLRNAGQIGKIRVHPHDADLVYVAALGHIFGPNSERGVFRSTDGGTTWKNVHFISERTGVVDLAMDPTNPRILMAAAWRAERKPWAMISGSEEGGIYRSVDGGETWKKLEGGMPDGLVGRSSVSISQANGDRAWALLEAEGDKGGVYRTDDGGESWERVNGDANLRQRAWYYTHIYADPKDEETVYAHNTRFYKSIDGGRTFDQQIQTPHGDNHDLWLNPNDPRIMINANDGGASVSLDGGDSWSTHYNQLTSQIYRVFVDDQWPYRIYASQQDNSTISVPSRARIFRDLGSMHEWYDVGGCESGHIAVDPRDPDLVYAGCYGGQITRIHRRTGERRQILHYPQLQLGQAARDLKYRFQWNAPIRLSPHDPDILYHASQVVHMSKDEGQSWTVISPDLTTNNLEYQDSAGGPINYDNTGVEVYDTIFAFEESPHKQGLMWAGTDDGRIQLSRNAGASWSEITPAAMPEGGTVNVIELSAHDAGRAFVAVYRYRENDFRPYIFRTDNYGANWDLLTDGTNGVPNTTFVRAIREDPDRKGLLYAGTEFGMYVSFDDGRHWQAFQLNLPVTPITDLQVHRKDLVVSTQGRSLWVFDDLSPLHQITDEVTTASAWLFAPRAGYRGSYLGGVTFTYFLIEETDDTLKLEILDGSGNVLRTFVSGEDEVENEAPDLSAKAGVNRFQWDLREEAPEIPEDIVHWGSAPGIQVVPGRFEVRLSKGEWSQTRPLEVRADPRSSTTIAQLREQYNFGKQIASEMEVLFETLTNLRDVRHQSEEIEGRIEKAGVESDEVSRTMQALNEELVELEEKLTQVKSKSSQDPINFPPGIDNQLTSLYQYVVNAEYQPTAGAYERFADLKPDLDALSSRFEEIVSSDLAALNRIVSGLALPPVVVPKASATTEPDLD